MKTSVQPKRFEWMERMYKASMDAQLLEHRPIHSQVREYVFCRDCVFYYAHTVLGWSSSEMERAFGKHRHTIMGAVRNVESLIDWDDNITRVLRVIKDADPFQLREVSVKSEDSA